MIQRKGLMRGWVGGLLATLVLAPAGWADTLDAESRIVAVTVFPDRALVTRRADVKLSNGIHAVRIASLPGTIESDSLSVKGSGESKVTLFGARLVTTQLESPQPTRIKELEDQLTSLNDRVRQLQDVKAVLEQERKFLNSIQAASSEQIGKDLITTQPSVAEVERLLAFLDRALTDTYQKSLNAEAQQREIDKQIDRLKRELAQLRGEASKQQAAIEVDLEAEGPGRVGLEVSYRLPGASWQPLYEARAAADAKTVELVMSGLVRQRTGEEWDEVILSLSTARPAVHGRMPEIQPWWLRKMEPMARFAGDKVARKASHLRAAYEAAGARTASPELGEMVMDEAVMAEAAVDTKGPAVVFTLPKRETVSSDWQPRKAAIRSHTLPAHLAYEVTPRLSPFAYLRAKVTNETDLVFLPGEVQVFLDGAFVGTSSVDLIGPTEEFDLYLGVDERIRVERKPLKAKVDVSVLPGVHGRLKTIDYEFLTTIENRRTAPAGITVIDQIPVSQHDEIKIEQVVFEPKPTASDPEKPGVHRWILELPPGGKQAIKLSYRLKHPVDFAVEEL